MTGAALDPRIRPGVMVRLIGHRAGRNAKAGKVIGVQGDKVIVQPGGHKRPEAIPARFVRYWVGGNGR